MKKYHDYVIDGYLAGNGRIVCQIRLYKYTERIIDGICYQSGEIDFSDNRVAELTLSKSDIGELEVSTVYDYTNKCMALKLITHFASWGDCYRYFRAINRKKNPQKCTSILKEEI